MLEARLKRIRGVGQAVAVGDGRKYISALLTLDPDNAGKFAADLGIEFTGDIAALSEDPALIRYIDEQVALVNADLARFEQVKKVAILPEELSMEAGELTPTMKLKRKGHHPDARGHDRGPLRGVRPHVPRPGAVQRGMTPLLRMAS